MKRTMTSVFFAVALAIAGSATAAESTRGGSLSEAVPDTAGSGGIYISAGAGLALYNGSTGWGLNVNVLTPIGGVPGLYAGADLGATFWSSSTAGVAGPAVSASMTGFQLTPTAIYRFDIASATAIHPYVGLSLGPNIFRTSVNNVTDTKLFLQAMFRPGIFIGISDTVALMTEAKFGWLGGNFIFFPHANLSFSI